MDPEETKIATTKILREYYSLDQSWATATWNLLDLGLSKSTVIHLISLVDKGRWTPDNPTLPPLQHAQVQTD